MSDNGSSFNNLPVQEKVASCKSWSEAIDLLKTLNDTELHQAWQCIRQRLISTSGNDCALSNLKYIKGYYDDAAIDALYLKIKGFD